MVMQERIRNEVDDAFVAGMDCAICTAAALRVNHLSKFADYISCDECGSSFVIEEEGNRVLYGKVSDDYSDTKKVVLKNWMSLTVVSRLAGSERLRREIEASRSQEERPPEEAEAKSEGVSEPIFEALESAVQEESPDDESPGVHEDVTVVDLKARLSDIPERPIELPEGFPPMDIPDPGVPEIPEETPRLDVEARLVDSLRPADEALDEGPQKEAEVIDALEVPEAMALEDVEAGRDAAVEPIVEIPIVVPPVEKAVPEPPVQEQASAFPINEIESAAEAEPVEEPVEGEPETYYRVRLEGESVYFPTKACVHCMKTPANHKTSVIGSLPVGISASRRRRAVFSVPVCTECRQKFSARSEAQKNARLQAHLTSLIVGLALVVAAVGLNVIDMSRNAAVGLLLAGIIAGVGYLLPVVFLLDRAERVSPHRESHLVRTTLLVRPPDEPVAESLFDFRNKGYAQLFRESNPNAAMDDVREFIFQPESPSEKG
jgi:hypothetical protein